MFRVNIFRFNAKNDVNFYYKPYFFEKLEEQNLREFLGNIKKIDPYFDFDKDQSVKINGFVVNLGHDLKEIIDIFGNEFNIDPLNKQHAYKDLMVSLEFFEKSFERFSEFESQKGYYNSLLDYFYASDLIDFKPDFIGNSAFVFAKYLINSNPSKEKEILDLIKDDILLSFDAKILGDTLLKESVEFLKSKLPTKKNSDFATIFGNFLDLNSKFEIKNKTKFANFTAAVYGDDELVKFAKNLGLKTIKLQNSNLGFDILHSHQELALELASKVLFDGFDSGADFLLVNDKRDFYMLDAMSEKLCKKANRKTYDFYILRADEVLNLANGQVPQSLKEHKLKPIL